MTARGMAIASRHAGLLRGLRLLLVVWLTSAKKTSYELSCKPTAASSMTTATVGTLATEQRAGEAAKARLVLRFVVLARDGIRCKILSILTSIVVCWKLTRLSTYRQEASVSAFVVGFSIILTSF